MTTILNPCGICGLESAFLRTDLMEVDSIADRYGNSWRHSAPSASHWYCRKHDTGYSIYTYLDGRVSELRDDGTETFRNTA